MKDFWSAAGFSVLNQIQRLGIRSGEGDPDESALADAIERVVEGANPKLRAVSGYRKKLRPYMQRALDHATRIATSIPGPLNCDRRTWTELGAVNAFFSGVQELQRVFSGSRELRALFEQQPILDEVFALLTMKRQEATTFGTDVNGEMLRRDVRQITVGFSEHHVDMPSATEGELREKLKARAFDVLICQALKQISTREERLHEIETELSKLRTKKKLLDTRSTSLEMAMIDTDARAEELKQLAERISESEQALESARAEFYELEDSIDVIAQVFGEPERYVALTEYCAFLNRLNVQTSEEGADGAQEVCVSELVLCHDLHRVVVVARFPRSELQPEELRLQEAERYLQ